jgi:hypothetical protein
LPSCQVNHPSSILVASFAIHRKKSKRCCIAALSLAICLYHNTAQTHKAKTTNSNPFITTNKMTAQNLHSEEIQVPDMFVCPLTLDLMQDPVISKYGQSYEREAILQWLTEGHTVCPLTRRRLEMRDIITNHKLRAEIRKWQVQNEQDVTVFVAPTREVKFCGLIAIPEKDSDSTDRTEDDIELDIDERPSPEGRDVHHRRRTRGHHHRGERRGIWNFLR